MKSLFFWKSTNRTIGGRLCALRTGETWSLAALAAIFVATLAANYFFVEQRDTAVALRASARQTLADMQGAGVHERDFQLHRREADLERHAADMKHVLDTIARANLLAQGDPEAQAGLQELDRRIKAYQAHFSQAVDASRKLGLDESKGLEGKLRDAVHAVEAIVRDSHQDPLMVSMLQLRRHEKDFLNRDRDEYVKKHEQELVNFNRLLAAAPLPAPSKAQIATLMSNYERGFGDYVEGRHQMEQDLAVAREASDAAEGTAVALVKRHNEIAEQLQRRAQVANRVLATLQLLLVAAVGLGVTIALRRTSEAIDRPLAQLSETVVRLAGGDAAARARIESDDEFGAFGRQLDRMVDEREAVAAQIRNENQQLNDSVLGLLQAVAQLSNKDLTVKVPVTANVTGAVADALNLLTGETSKVLQQVSDISADVADASLKVKQQSDTVMTVAEEERRQVEHTVQSLESASRTMATIADLAQTCNSAADRAIKTTEQALQTVNSTVGGINNTRETIRETEKRIKRLGERSQEISVAVNLINSIAERTHILALNAAMHAASAGEAGRGFAVVADEVQRLAESARQATQQIATLVSNIQLETADTVNTMNSAITQVVEGSRLAEQAGQQMQATQQTTAELVSSVQRIAQQSQEQVYTSNQLRERAVLIKKSTEQTSKELSEQTEQTGRLVEYARSLLSAVRVFKLSST